MSELKCCQCGKVSKGFPHTTAEWVFADNQAWCPKCGVEPYREARRTRLVAPIMTTLVLTVGWQ